MNSKTPPMAMQSLCLDRWHKHTANRTRKTKKKKIIFCSKQDRSGDADQEIYFDSPNGYHIYVRNCPQLSAQRTKRKKKGRYLQRKLLMEWRRLHSFFFLLFLKVLEARNSNSQRRERMVQNSQRKPTKKSSTQQSFHQHTNTTRHTHNATHKHNAHTDRLRATNSFNLSLDSKP